MNVEDNRRGDETQAAQNVASLEKENVFRERLGVAFGGFAYFELLYSACKIDLFGHLRRHGGLTLGRLSVDLGLPLRSMRVLLLGTSFLGLTKKERDEYFATPLSETYRRDHACTQWPILRAYHAIIYEGMHSLSDSLEKGTNVGLSGIPGSGRTIYERLAENAELEKQFHDWMRALNASVGLLDPVVEFLGPTMEAVSHLVDYGGGDASIAITLCRRHPHLRVTVFDLSSPCELARKNVQDAGMSDRVDLRIGNFLEDDFIDGVDAVMFNHIFNIYSPETNAELLRKSAASLVDGGVALIFNTVSLDTEDGPACAPFLSAYFLALATGEGMVYPLADYDEWLADAGFDRLEKVWIPEINHGLLIATRG
jgi:hypothetical protein